MTAALRDTHHLCYAMLRLGKMSHYTLRTARPTVNTAYPTLDIAYATLNKAYPTLNMTGGGGVDGSAA